MSRYKLGQNKSGARIGLGVGRKELREGRICGLRTWVKVVWGGGNTNSSNDLLCFVLKGPVISR